MLFRSMPPWKCRSAMVRFFVHGGLVPEQVDPPASIAVDSTRAVPESFAPFFVLEIQMSDVLARAHKYWRTPILFVRIFFCSPRNLSVRNSSSRLLPPEKIFQKPQKSLAMARPEHHRLGRHEIMLRSFSRIRRNLAGTRINTTSTTYSGLAPLYTLSLHYKQGGASIGGRRYFFC